MHDFSGGDLRSLELNDGKLAGFWLKSLSCPLGLTLSEREDFGWRRERHGPEPVVRLQKKIVPS
jgi:hypothetical protein